MKNRKFFYIVLVAVFLFFGVYIFVINRLYASLLNYNVARQQQALQMQVQNVTLTINFGNGNTVSYVSKAGKTAFAVLQEATTAKNLKLSYKTFSTGVLVSTIGTMTNTTNLSWIYFVNGKAGSVAADKYVLQPGDKLEWKYVKPQGQ